MSHVPLDLAVIALVSLLILWKLPIWQVGRVRGLNSKEQFDRVNEARKTLATVLGGAALLAGFYGTWQNLKVAQETAKVAQETSDTSQRALLVSEEGQITDRFTKAIEQLGAVDLKGNPKLDVRLGGIYSLEAIANESTDFHWPIMEVLCTYVREHSVERAKKSPRPRIDIQTILTVLGRRDRKYEKGHEFLNLFNADLRGGNLANADLSGAWLTKADLSWVFLTNADLRGASLQDADLSGAYVDGALFRGADLRGANLSDARGLTQGQIHGTRGDATTKLPAKLYMPESWTNGLDLAP